MKKYIILVLLVIVAKGFAYPMDFYNTPICAKLQGYYKTFPNIQALMMEIKYTGNVWCLVKLTECHNIHNTCPLDYKPICAYSEILNQFKTFPNQCLMNMEIYTTGYGWIAAFPFVCPRYSQSYSTYPLSYQNPSYEYTTPSVRCATTTTSPIRHHTNYSVFAHEKIQTDQADNQFIKSFGLLNSEQEISTENPVFSILPSTVTDITQATELSTITDEPTMTTTTAQETFKTDQADNQLIKSFGLLSSDQEISTENPSNSTTFTTLTDVTTATELTLITEEPTTVTTESEIHSTMTTTIAQETFKPDQANNQQIKSFSLLSSDQEISTENPSKSTTFTSLPSTISEEPTTVTNEAGEESTMTTTIARETVKADQADNQMIKSFGLLSSDQEISTENPAKSTSLVTLPSTITGVTKATELSTITEEPTTGNTEAGEHSTMTTTIAQETLNTDQADNQLIKSFGLLSSDQEISTESPAKSTTFTTLPSTLTDVTKATELSTITAEPTTGTTESREQSTMTTTIAQETLNTDQADNQLIKSFGLLSSDQDVSTENSVTSGITIFTTLLPTTTDEPTTDTSEAVTTDPTTTTGHETLKTKQSASALDTDRQLIKSFKLLSSEQEISTENPPMPTTSACSTTKSRLLEVISQPLQKQSASITRTNQHNIYNGPYAERDFYHQPIHNYFNWSPLNASLAYSQNITEFPFTNSPLVGPNSNSPYMGQIMYGPYAFGIPVFPINSLIIVNFNDWLNFIRGLEN